MSEFTCEFCKAEYNDKSKLQRHIKTSKKCLSKRTPFKTTPSNEAVEIVPTEEPSTEQASPSTEQASPSTEQASPSTEQASPSTEQASPSTEQASPSPPEHNIDDLLTNYNKALKQLEEYKKEILKRDEKILKLRAKMDQVRRDIYVSFDANMYCICGFLAFLKETKMMEQVLNETLDSKYLVEGRKDKFERDVLITLSKKKKENSQ